MLAKPNFLEIGRLDERITLLDYSVSRGPAGGESLTWSTLAVVWGAIINRKYSEKIEGEKQTAFNTLEIIIRYRTDFDEKNRLSFKGVEYDIEGIQEINRRTYLRIIATRKDGQ